MFKPINCNYLILILPKGFNVFPLFFKYNTIKKMYKSFSIHHLTYLLTLTFIFQDLTNASEFKYNLRTVKPTCAI